MTIRRLASDVEDGAAIAPWLVAQVAVMPMMGAPMFSGSISMAMGSLRGHLIYGGVVGAVYGAPVDAKGSGQASA